VYIDITFFFYSWLDSPVSLGFLLVEVSISHSHHIL